MLTHEKAPENVTYLFHVENQELGLDCALLCLGCQIQACWCNQVGIIFWKTLPAEFQKIIEIWNFAKQTSPLQLIVQQEVEETESRKELPCVDPPKVCNCCCNDPGNFINRSTWNCQKLGINLFAAKWHKKDVWVLMRSTNKEIKENEIINRNLLH